jgi:ABC-2 type transport system permease protein
VSAAVRPLIWLIVIGSGFNAVLGQIGPYGYHQFLVPGVLGMVMLFGAMLVSLTLVYDKEFGVMRQLIIAPLPHYWIVVAKIISGAVVAVVQAGAFALLLAIFGYVGPEVSIGLLMLGLVATALACASLGMVIAVWSSTLDNFAVVMNFVIFPVFFLSGALYPVHKLPDFLKVVAAVNPFTYGVDMLKHALLGYHGAFGDGLWRTARSHSTFRIHHRCHLCLVPTFFPRVSSWTVTVSPDPLSDRRQYV